MHRPGSHGEGRTLPALAVLVSLLLLASPAALGGPSSVDWDALPTYEVGTTQGSFLLTLRIQTARNETDLHVRASFDYPVQPEDPEMVYFAVEFDLSGQGRPMAAGDEMIIVSRKAPSGQVADRYSYFVEATERSPVPAPTNVVTLETFDIVGSSYSVEFSRSLQTVDTVHHQQFTNNTSVRVDFAVGEWGIGRSHSYTAMSHVLEVTDTEVLLTKPATPVFALRLTRETANFLGQGVLFVVLALIGVHIFRRRTWSRGSHNPGSGHPPAVEVERHSRLARATHVGHMALLLTFVATGWSMLSGRPVFGGGTLPVHMAAAFLLLVNMPLHFVALAASGEWNSLVRITRDDLRVAGRLSLNFFGLSKEYPEHVTYDPGRSGYYLGRKYCAFQKFLLWGDVLFFTVMALTGFALYFPGGLDGLQAVFGGREATLAFHDMFFYFLTSTVLGHVYFSVIPTNWSRLKSILSGRARVPVHVPESGGARGRVP